MGFLSMFSPSGIMAALVIGLSISNVVFIKMYGSVSHEYATFKSDVREAEKRAAAEAEQERLGRERITEDVSRRWADALDLASRDPVVRVLPRNCNLPQAGTLPVAGLKPDAATAQPGLGGTVLVAGEECESRLNNAAHDAAQVMMLQEWARRQHEVVK